MCRGLGGRILTSSVEQGETCGMKLVFETTFEGDICKVCKDIEKKQRKWNKLSSDITRWRQEGNRKATIEKAEKDLDDVEKSVLELNEKHYQKVHEEI